MLDDTGSNSIKRNFETKHLKQQKRTKCEKQIISLVEYCPIYKNKLNELLQNFWIEIKIKYGRENV